jgi:ectoine hydroxylase-related dioxygenase (phytanoyl-CoA dioxygenase family)
MIRQVKKLDDLRQDLANRYRSRPTSGTEGLDPDLVEADWSALQRDGYVVLRHLLEPSTVAALRAILTPMLGPCGRNAFEGRRTQRVYSVVCKTREVDALVEHPRILALLDRLLSPNYLLSQAQVINILPGEDAQLLHHDDSGYRVPRPRAPLGAATVWALDDFTEDNGATSTILGSHLWPDDKVGLPEEATPCVMPAGSAVLFLGTLWHGGGANGSGKPRLAITCQYCEPWLRQHENLTLAMPRDTARGLSENLLKMIGYSINPPFHGMVNGMHPRRLLEQSADAEPKI